MSLPRNEWDVSADRVNAFREVTRDPNELHKIYALGIQEWLMARERADFFGEPDDKTYVDVHASFDNLVPVDSVLTASPGQNEPQSFTDGANATNLIVPLELRLGDATVLSTEFNYVKFASGDDVPKDLRGVDPESILIPYAVGQAVNAIENTPDRQYPLRTADAEQAAYGLGQEGANFEALAIGFLSAQLFEDGKEVIAKYPNKQPVYEGHRLILTPHIRTLQDGDHVTIKTYTVREGRKNLTVGIVGYRGNDALYRGTVDIRFVNPKVLTRKARKE